MRPGRESESRRAGGCGSWCRSSRPHTRPPKQSCLIGDVNSPARSSSTPIRCRVGAVLISAILSPTLPRRNERFCPFLDAQLAACAEGPSVSCGEKILTIEPIPSRPAYQACEQLDVANRAVLASNWQICRRRSYRITVAPGKLSHSKRTAPIDSRSAPKRLPPPKTYPGNCPSRF
jgi:hypothetical protein